MKSTNSNILKLQRAGLMGQLSTIPVLEGVRHVAAYLFTMAAAVTIEDLLYCKVLCNSPL